MASFKVRRVGLGTGTGDIFWGSGVGVVLEPDLEDIKLESISDLEPSTKSFAKSSIKSLIGSIWDLLSDLSTEIIAVNPILVYIKQPYKCSLT